MADSTRPYEKWVWLDLLGFDNTRPDMGVGEYIDVAGFTPQAVCLMLSAVDFVLQHDGMEHEAVLPPDMCSRKAHRYNQDRERQVWTNWQVRALLAELHRRGIESYVCVFTQTCVNKYHREWVSDHPEVQQIWSTVPYAPHLNINSLARLSDATYYEDYFCHQLVRVLEDYGFDGWHGADGYGPLSGPIFEVDFSDDMIGQFTARRPVKLPACVTAPCGHDLPKLKARADWIWRNARREWIDFYCDRWTTFWKKIVDALHARGKKAFINSAWTRDPFEAMYRYGIDYCKIAETGVDGIVVETVASGMAIIAGGDYHYDYLAMLMLIKAYVPQTKLIFLHSVHDIVEQWDALRHGPTILEKDIYSLANVCVTGADGRPRPCVDGFLVCLGDGLNRDEWRWLRERWRVAFDGPPRRTLGATLVWSDRALHGQIDDFTRTRTWTTHRILFHLLARAVPVQSSVNVRDLDRAEGTLLVTNPHLFPADELADVLAYRAGPVVLLGPKPPSVPKADVELRDVYGPGEMWCGVYGATIPRPAKIEADGPEEIPPDLLAVTDPRHFRFDLYYRKVSKAFLDTCAKAILAAANCVAFGKGDEEWYFGTGDEPLGVMLAELPDGRIRVAIKNGGGIYAAPGIDLRRPIKSVTVVSPFPRVEIEPKGATFSVKVPGRGITVVDVEMLA